MLSHKITEALDGDSLTGVGLGYIQHSTAVTNEALGVLSRLMKPGQGFKKLQLIEFMKMDEKLSDTVVDQFVLHCKHIETL